MNVAHKDHAALSGSARGPKINSSNLNLWYKNALTAEIPQQTAEAIY
jgi:hypothetical protein